MSYERNHSHSHCWNQEFPACGQSISTHKQCCLCDTSKPSKNKSPVLTIKSLQDSIDFMINSTPEKGKTFNYPTHAGEDGLALFSGLHPRPPFFKKIFQAIKAIFVRPKLSWEAIEPAEPLSSDDYMLFFNLLKETIDHETVEILEPSEKGWTDTWTVNDRVWSFRERQELYEELLRRKLIKERPEAIMKNGIATKDLVPKTPMREELLKKIHKLIIKTFKTAKKGYHWIPSHFNNKTIEKCTEGDLCDIIECLTSKKKKTECPIHHRIHGL